MNNLLNKIFGISQRSTGKVDEKGEVTVTEIISYDIVSESAFEHANFGEWVDIEKIRKEMERQELLKNRLEKIQKLDSL